MELFRRSLHHSGSSKGKLSGDVEKPESKSHWHCRKRVVNKGMIDGEVGARLQDRENVLIEMRTLILFEFRQNESRVAE
jgi:hypothetical protein